MKELNLIFVKDPHLLLGFSKPVYRKDNFFELIDKKWTFLLNYYLKNNIDDLIVTGDIFDKMTLSRWSFSAFLENKKFFQKIKKTIGKPIVSIRGNHDEFNGKNSNEDTVFETLIELGLIEYIGENFKTYIIEDKKINLHGFDYRPVDNVLFNEIKERKLDGDYNIAMLHTSVVDVKQGNEKFSCIGYDNLIKLNNNFDMWVLGHFHKGFPTKYYKEKYFINPWNMTRLARDEYVVDDRHKPEFVHVTFKVENDKIIVSDIKNIELPHLPFNEAFYEDIKTISEQIVNEFEFFTKLEETVEENFDELVYLEELKKDGKINSKVYDLIKQLMKE